MPELGHGDDNFGIAGERFSARCLEVTPEATERERERAQVADQRLAILILY